MGTDNRQDTLVGTIIAPIASGEHTRILGSKQYENSNHLGNVLVTISDTKIPNDYNGDFVVDYYTADIKNALDYYAFGGLMPGRTFTNDGYRFGFNGMERDDEAYGAGNAYNFGARIQDSRLGRWLSLDPMQTKYPGNTPYSFVGNSPIMAKDPDGKLIIFINGMDFSNQGGTRAHWGSSWLTEVQKWTGDYNSFYFDGSVGGISNYPRNNSESYRKHEGFNSGYNNAKDIIASLEKDATGNIVEPIRFITSSMGASYQRGFSQGLASWVTQENLAIEERNAQRNSKIESILKNIEYGLTDGDEGWDEIEKLQSGTEVKISINVEWVLDLDPHQTSQVDPNAGRNYVVRSSDNDMSMGETIFTNIFVNRGNAIPGAIDTGLDANGKSVMGGHHPSYAPVEQTVPNGGRGAGDSQNPTNVEHPK